MEAPYRYNGCPKTVDKRMEMIRMKRIIWAGVLMIVCCLISMEKTHAAIKDPNEFSTAQWEYLNEVSVVEDKGWVQSMCVTDKYIVCFENATKKNTSPDTLIALYKNDYDEEGNPVPRYSYAKHITERDYEHGNGMTYNPNTNEIYIAAGPLLDAGNAGNIYVIDADTLEYKRTVNVGGGQYNYWCLSYSEKTNQYILRGDSNSGWIFFIADENFNIVDTITDIQIVQDTSQQDFCISGDYIISSCYDRVTKQDNYVDVYSISGRSYVGTYYVSLSGWERKQESESICEIEPGRFIIAAGTVTPRRIRFYETKITAVYDILTEAENGKITESTRQAEEKEDYQVTFEPDKHYELAELTVDGKVVDSKSDQTSYTFKSLKGNHKISAVFSKIPKYKITTKVTNGTITKSKSIYRDKNYTVTYQPDEYYELNQIRIDGEPIDIKDYETDYSFSDIQKSHSIEVEFSEIPSWKIETSVVNGTISPAIPKAYRDTTESVSYKGNEDYMLLYIEVDGKRVDKETYENKFTFDNIQQGHEIRVVYIWKHMFLTIGIGVMAAAMVINYLLLIARRRKRRIRR